MSMSRTICLALTAALLASACQREADAPGAAAPDAPAPAPAATETPDAPRAPTATSPVAFDCGGIAVQAVFDGQSATLLLDGERIALTTTPAASGARYEGTRADGSAIEFWTKGEGAMLSVAGNASPECAQVAAASAADTAEAPTGWRARGNEPFWMAEVVGGELRWTTPDSPEPRVWAVSSRRSQNGDLTIAASWEGSALALLATKALCRDSMSGMPFPQTVTVRVDDRELKGCGGEPIELLIGSEWTVTSVGGATTGERPPTLAFSVEGRAAGFAGCNRWMAGAVLTGEGLGFDRAATTMMACPDEAMQAEQAFIDALGKVTRHDFDEAGNLLLKAGDTTLITAARAAVTEAAPQG